MSDEDAMVSIELLETNALEESYDVLVLESSQLFESV